MVDINKLVESHYGTDLTKTLLYEYIEDAIREQEESQILYYALEKLRQYFEKSDYPFAVKGDNVIIIFSDEERRDVLEKIHKEIERLGFPFEFSYTGSTVGRLELRNLRRRDSGRKIGLYLYVKEKTPGVARESYNKGVRNEKIVAQNIMNAFPNVKIIRGGNTRKPDIIIYVDGIEKTRIEVKTSVRTDIFQQFKVKWTPYGWQIKKTSYHNPLNDRVFKKYIKPWMDKNATFTEEEVKSDLFKKNEKGHILGIKFDKLGNEEHIKTRNKLNRWFGGNIDFFIDIDFEDMKRFYNIKGDDYININNYGLFGTSQRAANKINVPNFQKQDIYPRARLRVKSHGGSNNLTFTISYKTKGKMETSNINLYTDKNVEQIKNLLK